MLTHQEAESIYDAGKETVVRVLMDMDRRIHALERQVQDLTVSTPSDRALRGLRPIRFVQTLNVPFGVVTGIRRTPAVSRPPGSGAK